jgi:carboxymethylenebutenolidase
MPFVKIPAGAGEIPAWFSDPGGEARGGVVILHEIFGVNAAMRDEAERWAREGYVVLVPDLFHRIETGVALDYTPEDRKKAVALWEELDLEQALRDSRAAATWLRTSSRCAGKLAAIGFCLGGQLAVLAGNHFDAIVSFYPVRLQDHRAAIETLRQPALVHLGTDDIHIAPDVISMLQAEIGARSNGSVVLHKGAEHAFYNSFRSAGFAPEAAAAARASTATFLARHLR